jgi:hypothetical protein
MVKNLDVAGFRNGDAIPEAKSDDAWREAGNNNQSAWCWYDNDPANGAKFGRLYNWYAVADPRGLCPAGWHVPSDEDWTVLENKLGGRNIAGEKMKASGRWKSYETKGRTKTCPNCASWSMEYRRKVPCHTCKDTRSINAPMVMKSGNGSNSSGFTGLPGGYRDYGGTYNDIGVTGLWWSSTEYSSANAWFRFLDYGAANSTRANYASESFGFSVRCLRD